MMSADDKPPAATSATEQVEYRGKAMNILGNTMGIFIACVFVGVYVLRSYQLDFWGQSFYKNADRIETGCEYAALSTPEINFPYDKIKHVAGREVKLPHGPEWFRAEARPNQILHVQYRCFIPRMSTSERKLGVPVLHFGWIMADASEIVINGEKRLAFKGSENLSLALSGSEYIESDVMLTVNTSGVARRRFGIAGTFPMAIGKDSATNFKIRGLEMALLQITPIYTLLPLLTLATVLVFGWFMGLKSQLIVVTFFYFSLNLMFNALLIYGDLVPLIAENYQFLARPFQISSWLAILLIGLELLQWRNRRVYLLGGIILVALAIEVFVIAMMKFPHAFVGPLWQSYRVIGMIGGMVLFAVAWHKTKTTPKTQRNVLVAFMALMTLYSLLLFADFMVNATNSPIQIGHYMELLLPLFISGLIFYTLSQIEKRLKLEREQRAVMESELNIAAKLQGILLPAESKGTVCDIFYEIDSKPLGILGGDWVKIHSTSEKALFVLGDVVGKGPSAALTHSAIASAWEAHITSWADDEINTETLLKKINGTMFNLFKGSMNSTFAAFEIANDQIRVACGGNLWLHLEQKKPHPVGVQARALLGVKADLEVKFQAISVEPGDWFVTFTDGVLEGNRPLKKFVTAVTGAGELSGDKIRELLHHAGENTVHADDASSLVLRFKQSAIIAKTA